MNIISEWFILSKTKSLTTEAFKELKISSNKPSQKFPHLNPWCIIKNGPNNQMFIPKVRLQVTGTGKQEACMLSKCNRSDFHPSSYAHRELMVNFEV